MLEELTDIGGVDLSEVKNPNGGSTAGYDNFQRQQPKENNWQNNQDQSQRNNQSGNWNNNNQQPQRQNNWQGKQNNGGGGGNWQGGGNRGGGGGGNWNKKEDVIEEPYVPVTIYIDRDFPPEIKQKLIALASKFINKGIVVRYNGDDVETHNAISEMSSKLTESYTPWKGFNNIESKYYYNTETAKHVASVNFQGWDKLPDVVKSMMARNVRMIFGDKNRNPTLCLITWSPDGASKAAEVTKDTGRAGFIVKLASTYCFSVVNIAKPNAEAILEKAFNL